MCYSIAMGWRVEGFRKLMCLYDVRMSWPCLLRAGPTSTARRGAGAGGGSPSEVKYGQVGRADESFIQNARAVCRFCLDL